MGIELTGLMKRQITPEVRSRIERALAEFPELDGRCIRVGATRNPQLHGTAEAEKWTIRLSTRRRIGVTYFTIGHELTHLLQRPGLGVVPSGEVVCDIWTLARSPLFLDEMPTYLEPLDCTASTWNAHAPAVRALCIQGVQLRATHSRYIQWLRERLRVHFRSSA